MPTVYTEPEDGIPSVSWKNIYKMMQIHGSIVAVTHIITPKDEHITKIFFFEGKSWTALGLAMGYGEGHNEDRLFRAVTLSWVINSIPTMSSVFDDSCVLELGIGEDVKKAHAAGKNVVYHFFPPDQTTILLARECDGMIAFEDSADFLKEDGNDIRIINEWPIKDD